MVFNSTAFLVFFVAFFYCYWLINNKFDYRIRNAFIILASYIFYGWWDWRFLGLIFISSTSDFLLGLGIQNASKNLRRQTLLIASITINLGILGFFKYFDFFVTSLTDLLGLFSIELHTSTLNIILPVGISFYTFQSLSYTIDVYLKRIDASRDVVSFFAFVSFFPQLVAGPIVRAGTLLPQLQGARKFSYEDCIAGLRLILWGFVKKVVIADNLGVLVDKIFDPSSPASGITTLAGAVFFGLQIYADFSGYSDIAIGTARMLGIRLTANFKTPYFSSSPGEFWRRWHITLSTWFRDYVYIPLGGNRGTKFRSSYNILLTFLLSGLWHGAQLTFLIWGGLHGVLLVLQKQVNARMGKVTGMILTFLAVSLLWIPFRASGTEQMLSFATSLFSFDSYSLSTMQVHLNDFSIYRFIALMSALVLFMSIEFQFGENDFSDWISRKKKWVRFVFYYSLVIVFLFLGNFNVAPHFIYFQF